MIRRSILVGFALLFAVGALAEEVISAGQPNEAKIAEYAEQGYTTVIDLRGPDEDRGIDDEEALVKDAGMDYISLPISGKGSISFENANKLDSLLEATDGPVVVHCGSGNRVGALMALRASLNGASDEEALATGQEFGMTRLRGVVEDLLEGEADDIDQDRL